MSLTCVLSNAMILLKKWNFPDDGSGGHRNILVYSFILYELFKIILQCVLLEQYLDK